MFAYSHMNLNVRLPVQKPRARAAGYVRLGSGNRHSLFAYILIV